MTLVGTWWRNSLANSPHSGCPLLAWSADGTVLWTADGRRTRSWRAADGALLTNRSNSAPILGRIANGRCRPIRGGSSRLRARCESPTAPRASLQSAFVALPHEQAVVISPDGHFRGTKGVEKEIVYVVETSRRAGGAFTQGVRHAVRMEERSPARDTGRRRVGVGR